MQKNNQRCIVREFQRKTQRNKERQRKGETERDRERERERERDRIKEKSMKQTSKAGLRKGGNQTEIKVLEDYKNDPEPNNIK